MTPVFRRPAAERDLEDIWLAIAADSPKSATRILRAIDARIAQLAAHPRLGPRRKDIRAAMRMLVEASYLILYETLPDADEGHVERVEIVRVIDGRRDFARLL